jgi:peroxiredoxin
MKRGERAEDFELPAIGGERQSLSAILSTHRAVLLVFLRHLG